MIMKATEMNTLVLCPSHMQIGVISVPLPEGFDLLLVVGVGISPRSNNASSFITYLILFFECSLLHTMQGCCVPLLQIGSPAISASPCTM